MRVFLVTCFFLVSYYFFLWNLEFSLIPVSCIFLNDDAGSGLLLLLVDKPRQHTALRQGAEPLPAASNHTD
jgi:hypothetical protein